MKDQSEFWDKFNLFCAQKHFSRKHHDTDSFNHWYKETCSWKS